MLKKMSIVSFVLLAVALPLLTSAATSNQPGVQRPETMPLNVGIASSQFTANKDNRRAAHLIVAVNDATGPVTGFTENNFVLEVRSLPFNTFEECMTFEIGSVVESAIVTGGYLLEVVPSCAWEDHRYLVNLLVNGPRGSGVGVVELVVGF